MEEVNQNINNEKQVADKTNKPRRTIMSVLDLTQYVSAESIMKQLPFILFLAFLAILYIANAHYAEKTTKSIYQIEKELNELRWNYMANQSEFENVTKQSEVAKMVDHQGLKELTNPPIKIQSNGSQR